MLGAFFSLGKLSCSGPENCIYVNVCIAPDQSFSVTLLSLSLVRFAACVVFYLCSPCAIISGSCALPLKSAGQMCVKVRKNNGFGEIRRQDMELSYTSARGCSLPLHRDSDLNSASPVRFGQSVPVLWSCSRWYPRSTQLDPHNAHRAKSSRRSLVNSVRYLFFVHTDIAEERREDTCAAPAAADSDSRVSLMVTRPGPKTVAAPLGNLPILMITRLYELGGVRDHS